jgi:hypothetical protein
LGRNQNSVSVETIARQNPEAANSIATICCNFVFSSNQTSANSLLSEDCMKVELSGFPNTVQGPTSGFRELPSVVTWLQSSITSQSRIEYSCGQSLFETGVHYFEIFTEYEIDSSTIPLIGVIEADTVPSSSERFSGLCISALTTRNKQRKLVGCNAMGPLDLHESREPGFSFDGGMVSGFFLMHFSVFTEPCATIFQQNEVIGICLDLDSEPCKLHFYMRIGQQTCFLIASVPIRRQKYRLFGLRGSIQ